MSCAFEEIRIPSLPAKPRERGLTMVIDWGAGLEKQRGCVEAAGEYIDIAKIATGASRILRRDYLEKKIRLYKENNIKTFPGGQFLEIAILQGRVREYLEAAKEVGYEVVEVSDNAIFLKPEEKRGIIRQALDMGLGVIGEVGKKVAVTDPAELIADIENTLDSGAWKVFVEAKELFDEELNTELIERIAGSVDVSRLIFEVPGPWLPNVRHSDQFVIWSWLLKTFGAGVNIANVDLEDGLNVALLRYGLGADTSFEEGTFHLSKNGRLAK